MASRPAELLTVSRALRVLQAFTEEHPTWGITELATEQRLDKSQVHRILTTFTQHGFTVLDPDTRRYSLGPALVPLGRRAEDSPGLRHQLEPHLDKLAARAGESVVVCVPDGFRYRTIAACEGPGLVRYATALGRSFPGHLGATGQAIFAFQPTVSPADLLGAHGEPITDGAVAELEARYSQVRTDGYLVSEGEYDARVMAIAAPILIDGALFGSVSVLGPRDYMHSDSVEIVAGVLDSATAIGDALRP
ncbi:IclR family transcriptional regulator [Nocardioides insulae]|uniref:IclR family transcriptional regulator n=1 Tax=Nocardioides insulae TaxID=394734 RepID=UPI0003F9C12A|nr:IclR family transcriptional regulator [Nocardioides insulae]